MRLTSVRNHWLTRLAQLSLLVGLLVAASCTEVSQSSDDGDGVSGTSGAAGAPNCAAPTRACNGACVNTASDPANCGSCGTACVVGETCQAGQCTRSCAAPMLDCSGLCADPTSNSLHCGGCGRPCMMGQICQGSACVNGSCAAGETLCSGACANTMTSTTNCGACGNACLVGQACQSGVCTTVGGTGGTGGGAGMPTGGNAGMSTGGNAGMSTGGVGGMSTGGNAGMSTGGAGGMSGGRGGASGGAGAGGRGGSGGGVTQSTTCPNIPWPQSTGSRSLGGGMTVTNHDGGMQIHNGTLNNCANGDQDSTTPLITVQNGGSVRNVIMGNNVGDGIHCLGSCTIENVWFPYVCDDAITILGSGTVTIRNSGFKNARDKTIQHNGSATVTLDNIYVETAGKLYRSCGEGCESSAARTATIQNVVAVGVDQVAGISTNDRVTLRNICTYRTFSICSMYDPGTSDETENGVNQSNEGPSTNCIFTANDTHALLSRVTGIPFTTQSVCGGPNGYKSGNTATSCVSGFNSCLKSCMPGGYGFKEITCTNNRYAEGTGVICAMPTDATAAQNLAPSRVMAATQNVTDNDECSTQWAIGREESNNNNYCVCVYKPGYYSNPNWLAWDCQPRWW